MIKIERVEPFLEFEVVTEENKILNIKSLSYEVSGQYVTFYQKIIATETVPSKIEIEEKEKVKKYILKILDLHKNEIPEIILNEMKKVFNSIDDKNIIEQRKMPFLTLKNVKKISILNTEKDKFELIKEVGEIYTPQKTTLPQQQEFAKIEELTPAKWSNNNVNSTVNNISLKNESINKKTELNQNKSKNDELFDLINQNDNNSNNEIDSIVEENIENDNHNDDINILLGLDEQSNNENQSNDDDFDFMSLLNENNEYDVDSKLNSHDEILEGQDNENNNSEDENIDDLMDVFKEGFENPYTQKEIDEEEQISKQKFDEKKQSILDRIESLSNENGNYLSSEDEKQNKSEKYLIIKENLDEYLNRTNVVFNSKFFTENFLRERISERLHISEDDVVIQICNMIKQKEIAIHKFYNKKHQEIINKNKDMIRIYYDGNLMKLLKQMKQRNEETRFVTLIDLVVYMRKNNWFERK